MGKLAEDQIKKKCPWQPFSAFCGMPEACFWFVKKKNAGVKTYC
jgi:hypothetical protein